MRIVLASNNGGPEGIAFARRIRELGHEFVGLIQDGDRVPPDERRTLRLDIPLDRNIRLLALRESIPIAWLERDSSAGYEAYRRFVPDLLLVSCFSKIFNDEFLEVAKVGNVNVHPSLLPRHRGAHPHACVILDGDDETGVTFHTLTAGIDAGDIIRQDRLPVSRDDTSATLRERCSAIATAALGDVLQDIASRGVHGTPQDESQATYEPRWTRRRAQIDWTKSAEHIERQVRAGPLVADAWFWHERSRVLVETCLVREHVDAEPGTVVKGGASPVVATSRGSLEILDAQVAPPDDEPGTIYAIIHWPTRPLRQGESLTSPSEPF